ncbi:hypothetical protein A2767_07640 [Candidatus Roizmanbacteria bacterium RIFCSPHIGHO2_01_FULL_35_10]|uniref:Glycosyl transferase family 1 domain-containing protein n=1 Tax=Candidatus Roizmanbacteria bacterium RIFCSPLOWO2_01_FULL_35_13 TaxID=1802055 RepID=A0A1F7ICQ7_9BACT|nr:MAG: hypothetical protein A2767_07640 [Candidatus Roizmanbacteria bacterium RIFCSPHIGHO2_01_FULL_35_10]OGK41140.1 MAG: hypothetical protein A3A74_02240 [Candidatus Roizmanbacteria bacterium RIFCSPLOWO2_01_FULL_35_13]
MHKAKKSILWITNNWLLDFGGRKIVSKKILNFLALKKYQITVLDFEIGENLIHNNKKYVDLNRNISFNPFYLPNNKRVIIGNVNFSREKDFDFVIISGIGPVDLLTIASIRIFNLYTKTKIILFEHTNPLFSINLSKFRAIHKVLAQIFYKRTDFIITPAHSLKNLFVKKFGVSPQKIKVIPHPIIDTNINKLINEEVEEKVFKEKKSKIIITSARLDFRQKDYPTLLRAFKIVQGNEPNTFLAILGIGPDKAKIRQLAKKLNISKKILFLGFQKNPFKYIARSDAFILSSKFEGFGMVLIEAMACRVPVITTDAPFGPGEIADLGKNGLLIPVGDEQKMADAILNLLNNKKLVKKIVASGLIKIKQYLSRNSLRNWYTFLGNEKL